MTTVMRRGQGAVAEAAAALPRVVGAEDVVVVVVGRRPLGGLMLGAGGLGASKDIMSNKV